MAIRQKLPESEPDGSLHRHNDAVYRAPMLPSILTISVDLYRQALAM